MVHPAFPEMLWLMLFGAGGGGQAFSTASHKGHLQIKVEEGRSPKE